MLNTSNVEPPKPCSRRNDCQAELRPEVPLSTSKGLSPALSGADGKGEAQPQTNLQQTIPYTDRRFNHRFRRNPNLRTSHFREVIQTIKSAWRTAVAQQLQAGGGGEPVE